MIRITIHPIFMMLLLFIALTGNIALYSMIILALLLHEFGHLIAAKCVGARIVKCVIMPYGGEITLENEHQLPPEKLLLIACGGPLATIVGIFIAYFLPPLYAEPLITIQFLLLAINLFPIWPLDGGKIICNALVIIWPRVKIYETFLSFSLCFLTIIVLVTLLMLPRSMSLAVLSLFLWGKVIGEWRIRKYRSAFQKIVMNRLT